MGAFRLIRAKGSELFSNILLLREHRIGHQPHFVFRLKALMCKDCGGAFVDYLSRGFVCCLVELNVDLPTLAGEVQD